MSIIKLDSNRFTTATTPSLPNTVAPQIFSKKEVGIAAYHVEFTVDRDPQDTPSTL